MFPETFAEKWIQRLTKPGDTILDPFSGRGTTALTALLAGRNAVACDVNEVAFCLTSAKTNAPSLSRLKARIKQLADSFAKADFAPADSELSEFFSICFHEKTLAQILYLRNHLDWRRDKCDAMVAALALGSLHGDAGVNSPYFSNQMPRTISMNPDYSIRFWNERQLAPPLKDIFPILLARAEFRYVSDVPKGDARIFNTDMRTLPKKMRARPPINCVITSPPYLNVTSFEEDQWLRLWFLGAPGVPSKGRISRDDRHLRAEAYWAFIRDMWNMLNELVTSEAHVVIRMGSRSMTSEVMKAGLLTSAKKSNSRIRLVSSRVTELQRRQTGSFLPGSAGCKTELDCHFQYLAK